jgi:zinc D-Ala-D-Ala carboxypeptidase
VEFNPEMQLSKNFQLKEFLRSEYSTRLGMTLVPDIVVVDNLRRLCETVLQPIRDNVGRMKITSGYRPTWLNTAIGGSAASAHLFGCAADVEFLDADNLTIFREMQRGAIKGLMPNIDQVINEYPPDGWIHFGIARVGSTPREQFLVATHDLHGKVIYGNV